jgi:HSP20 family protein
MRYRRLSYRYRMVVSTGELRGPVDPWVAGRLRAILAPPVWRPEADVYETASTITVTVELAGVEEDQVEALLFEDALVIEGQRRLPACDEDGVYQTAAIRQGPFRLEVPLTARVDTGGIEARYQQGLLRIRLPKAALA